MNMWCMILTGVACSSVLSAQTYSDHSFMTYGNQKCLLQLYSSGTAVSLVQCVNLCSNHDGCNVGCFNRESSQCEVSLLPIHDDHVGKANLSQWITFHESIFIEGKFKGFTL